MTPPIALSDLQLASASFEPDPLGALEEMQKHPPAAE
jgi:hypothetical protein